MMLQELAEQESLLPQAKGAWIFRKQVAQFVAKDRSTAWFQNNDGQACVYLLRERLQDALQILFGLVQQAKVVKRTAAAKMCLWHHDVESRVRKYLQGSVAGFRLVVVVEGVRPQNHAASGGRHPVLVRPSLKAAWGEARHLA